jgi:hypothetical protein
MAHSFARRGHLAVGVVSLVGLSACDLPQRAELRDSRRAHAVLSACRAAMASLPPPGPSIDPEVYGMEWTDPRQQGLDSVLSSRTVRFDGPREGNVPWVVDPRLPPEIIQLQPLYVVVTPDAVHIGLCGAGLSCSVNAVRPGIGLEAVGIYRGGQPNCEVLVDGLWYCHE